MFDTLKSIRRRLGAAVVAVMFAGLAGCGGGGGAAPGGGGVAPAAFGDVTIAVRDAEGDFLTYTVDVTRIALRRANGDVVETVPFKTRVDFAELVELTELFTVASVPVGVYTGVVVGLDFTNAEIVAQNDAGDPVPVLPVDASGTALGRFDVRIELPSGDPVRIAAGVPAHVTLDFDLDASNTVDLAATPAVVRVEPFLTVIPEMERDREHRVRGLLASVDAAASAVTLKVRPFQHRQSDFGRFRFLTDAETEFEIDGDEYVGQAGIDALARLAVDTPVIAQGPVANRVLTADVVLAGTSVPWSDADVVHGVVTARSGDELTVRAARLHRSNGTVAFRGSLKVLVGDATGVTAGRLTDVALDHLSISVGQRIVAFGEFADDMTLDATEGRVRLLMSSLTGQVKSVAPLVVDLLRLNGLRVTAFDFAGTGGTSADDADPANYEIATGTLSLATLSEGDLARARGLVNAFGAAPPDFLARTVVDVDLESNAAALLVSWVHRGGTANPFVTVAPARLDVNLSGARYWLAVRGVPQALLRDGDSIALEPTPTAGIYGVVVRGQREIHLYRDFGGLVSELTRQLDAGRRMTLIHAHGRYNVPNAVMTTPRAKFEFVAP